MKAALLLGEAQCRCQRCLQGIREQQAWGTEKERENVATSGCLGSAKQSRSGFHGDNSPFSQTCAGSSYQRDMHDLGMTSGTAGWTQWVVKGSQSRMAKEHGGGSSFLALIPLPFCDLQGHPSLATSSADDSRGPK